MFSRSVARAAVDSPWRVPPPFLLPLRARLHSTQQFVEPGLPPSAPLRPGAPSIPKGEASQARTPPQPHSLQPQDTSQSPSSNSASEVVETPPVPLSETVKQLLPSLAHQTPHYATIHVHARPYMVTEGDHVLLPFHMPNVEPGDVLRLNRASLLGSRDFTLQGQPYVDDRLFECRAVVMGVEAEPMRFKEKTKRRVRRIKTVKSKHRYTKIAIQQLRVKDLSEIPQ